MLLEMTGEELMGWRAFASLEPFGSEREDLRAGRIAAAVSEPWRDKKAKSEPFSPWDFFPRPTAEKPAPKPEATEKASPKRVLQVLEAWGLAMGGQDRRKQRPRYE